MMDLMLPPSRQKMAPIFLGIKNVTEDGKLDFSEIRHITEDDFPAWTRRVEPRPGDLVFTYEATLNRYAIVPKGFRGCLGRRMALIRPDPSKVDTRFLFYYFFTKEWRTVISNNMLAGSTVDRIPLTKFPDFPVRVPPLPVQRRIAGILSAYDDLIENNQRRIKILEEVARSLYREWFVHFRFPGHENHLRVASPLGEIPKGWDAASFEEAAVFENGDRGKNYPSVSEFVEDGVPFINAGHLVDGDIDLSQVNRISEVKFEQLRSGKIREGDLLYCLRGSPGRTARTAGIRRGAIASSLVIIRPTARANREFLYYTVSGESGRQMVSELDNGVAQPNISVGRVQRYPLLLPPKDVLGKFARFIEPHWRLIDALRSQLSVLKTQRDLLLPRLLSGQIELKSMDAVA